MVTWSEWVVADPQPTDEERASRRWNWEHGVGLCIYDEFGEPLEYVPRHLYERLLGMLSS